MIKNKNNLIEIGKLIEINRKFTKKDESFNQTNFIMYPCYKNNEPCLCDVKCNQSKRICSLTVYKHISRGIKVYNEHIYHELAKKVNLKIEEGEMIDLNDLLKAIEYLNKNRLNYYYQKITELKKKYDNVIYYKEFYTILFLYLDDLISMKTIEQNKYTWLKIMYKKQVFSIETIKLLILVLMFNYQWQISVKQIDIPYLIEQIDGLGLKSPLKENCLLTFNFNMSNFLQMSNKANTLLEEYKNQGNMARCLEMHTKIIGATMNSDKETMLKFIEKLKELLYKSNTYLYLDRVANSAYFMIGMGLILMRKYDEAITPLEQALYYNSYVDPKALVHLLHCLDEVKDINKNGKYIEIARNKKKFLYNSFNIYIDYYVKKYNQKVSEKELVDYILNVIAPNVNKYSLFKPRFREYLEKLIKKTNQYKALIIYNNIANK